MTTYRSPTLGDFDIFLQTLSCALDVISKGNKKAIITGDFNVQFHNPDKYTHALFNLFTSFGFNACNDSPTRQHSCLDNIFVNFSKDMYISNTIDPKISDHFGIKLTVKNCSPPQVSKKILYRPITDAGLFNLNTYLQQVDWGFIDDLSLNIDAKSEIFLNTITFGLEMFFPVKSRILTNDKKQNLRWFTDNLRQMRETLHLLQDIYKNNPSSDLKDLIHKTKRNYRQELVKARKTANDNYIHTNKNQPKAMWNLINANKSQKSEKVSNIISPDDFNNYFGNIAQNLINTLPPYKNNFEYYLNNSTSTHSDEKFTFSQLSYNQILNIIDNLKQTKSNDAYDVNVKVLNCIKYIILIPLTKLINQCISGNVFPKIFKLSKVLPLFKKDSADDPANYRPISIVPIFAKIFEVALKTQISEYFENYKLFNDCQYGFRSKMSTTLAINALTNIINKGFEAKEFIHVQFLDLSKAFDCVSHDILVNKLKFYNFSENSRNLIQSYLTERSQFVNHNNTVSNSININFGVPQGSVLGPVLFLIYINDLPNSNNLVNFTLFADDTTLAQTHNDSTVLISEACNSLSIVQDWCLSNQLILNRDKTESMTFSLKSRSQNFVSAHYVKFLGVTLDSKLTWEKHTELVCKKISRNIFLLRNLVNCVSQPTVLTAFHALIQSALSYAILIWGHSAHAGTVFSLQRKAVRIITGLAYRDDCREAFKNLNLLTLPCAYILQCLLHIKENLSKYSTHEDIHSYSTRNKTNVQLNFSRLTKTRNGTSYYAIKFFNVLPNTVQALDCKRFKFVIKRFLLENAFYDFQEFLSSDFSCINL